MSKILIIDDESEIRKLFKNIFDRNGYDLHFAVDGLDGLNKIKSVVPDIVILDLILPELSGYEVLTELNKMNDFDAPVLVLTGKKIDTNDKVKGFKEGAIDYITKPFCPIELLARVEALLHAENKKSKKVESERLKIKSQISVTLKHEINNPLAIILAQAELLQKEEYNFSLNAKKRLDSIVENAKRIKTVLGQLEKLEKIKSTSYIDGIDMIEIELK